MGQIVIATAAAPGTPSAGYSAVYVKSSDKKLYWKDDAGNEYGPILVGGAATFESSEQALPGTGTASDISVAHGLGRTPSLWKIIIRCKTAEAGYAIGDEVDMTPGHDDGTNEQTGYANATVVGLMAKASAMVISTRTSTTRVAVTPANWKLVFRAW